MEKHIDEIEKSKDDSSMMFKAIKGLNKMTPKTRIHRHVYKIRKSIYGK